MFSQSLVSLYLLWIHTSVLSHEGHSQEFPQMVRCTWSEARWPDPPVNKRERSLGWLRRCWDLFWYALTEGLSYSKSLDFKDLQGTCLRVSDLLVPTEAYTYNTFTDIFFCCCCSHGAVALWYQGNMSCMCNPQVVFSAWPPTVPHLLYRRHKATNKCKLIIEWVLECKTERW